MNGSVHEKHDARDTILDAGQKLMHESYSNLSSQPLLCHRMRKESLQAK